MNISSNYQEDLISIVIPLYNTNIDVFKRCLLSIENQDYKNIEVIIVDDYSTENYSNIIKYHSQFIKIKYKKLEHNYGPGVARRIGMEMVEGKYLFFVDSDDELYDNASIIKLYREMVKYPKLNMVAGLAYEELASGKMEKKTKNFIWVFGKLFRTQFFIDNNIKFNDTRANEDNGFTTLFRMLTDDYKFIDDIVYIWHFEPNSITRINNHEYYFWSIEGYVNNMIWVYEECKKRGIEKGEKQLMHFVNVWLRLYFYCIEILFDRNTYDANLLAVWCNNYYKTVYSVIEKLVSPKMFLDCWKLMVSSSPDTFINRIINISYPEFYNIISSNERLIEDEKVLENENK